MELHTHKHPDGMKKIKYALDQVEFLKNMSQAAFIDIDNFEGFIEGQWGTDEFRSVALLDWDDTLCEGFVIARWIEYLAARGKVSGECRTMVETTLREFNRGEKKYEDLVECLCEQYATAVAGSSVAELDTIAESFVRQDTTHVFEFTLPLVQLLLQSGIEPVLVSGSPDVLLRHYARLLGVDYHYGLELSQHPDGRYSGVVAICRGMEDAKEALGAQIPGETILAIGNSPSDWPLLKRADLALVLGRDNRIGFPDVAKTKCKFVGRDEVLPTVRKYLMSQAYLGT